MAAKKSKDVKGAGAVLDNDRRMVKKSPTKTAHSKHTRTGRWSREEKLIFLYGLHKFGRGKWKKIGTLLPSRSLIQIKSHAQKVMKRHEAGENVFAALNESRDLFDSTLIPPTHTRSMGTASLPATSMPRLVDECSFTMSKMPMKSYKGPLGKSSLASNYKYSNRTATSAMRAPRSPGPAINSRRSVFQATLGNGNLSFSFRPGFPPAEDGYCSLDSFNDSRGDSAIAAAALCQLSTTRKDQVMIVSP